MDIMKVKKAKNGFLNLLNQAGYKRNEDNTYCDSKLKNENKEEDVPIFNSENTNEEDVKITHKRKTKKEIEEEKYRQNHPYGNMKDDELIKSIFNHAKEVRGTEKSVGVYVYNSVAEKFKTLEETYFLINNNIIVDTLINKFYHHHENKYMEQYNNNLALILLREKKKKRQITYRISQDSIDKLEELRKEKYKHLSKTELINLVILSTSDRFIIENGIQK